MSRRTGFNLCDRPLAAPGLTSYRCRSGYGWIMIGARNNGDALGEARRTRSDAMSQDLQVWDGTQYVPVVAPKAAPIGLASACHS